MDNKNNTKEYTGKHDLSLKNRKLLEISGVREVITFNEEKIIIDTNQGNLVIKGDKLNIQKLNLDDGSIKIEGYIFFLEYTKKENRKGLIKKLFK